MGRVRSRRRPAFFGDVKASQNIEKYLKAKPEYVVNTNEFNDMKSRLLEMHNRKRLRTRRMRAGQRCGGIRMARSTPTAMNRPRRRTKTTVPTLKRRDN